MDVIFTTYGISSQGTQASHANKTVRQWLASMANMHPDGAYAFVMRSVMENPSSVIATLKRQLTPKVLGHMHSDSILSTRVVVDFKEYHFVQLCFDDLLSDSEWHERMHESRHLALARIMRDAQLPKEMGSVIEQYLG